MNIHGQWFRVGRSSASSICERSADVGLFLGRKKADTHLNSRILALEKVFIPERCLIRMK